MILLNNFLLMRFLCLDENDVNKIHFFESDRERKQQPRISCLLGIQVLCDLIELNCNFYFKICT